MTNGTTERARGFLFPLSPDQENRYFHRVFFKLADEPKAPLTQPLFDEAVRLFKRIDEGLLAEFRRLGIADLHRYVEPTWEGARSAQYALVDSAWATASDTLRQRLGSQRTFDSWYSAACKALTGILMLRADPGMPHQAFQSRGDFLNRGRAQAIRWLVELCPDVVQEHWEHLRNVREKNGLPCPPDVTEWAIAILEVAADLEAGQTPRRSVADVVVHSPPFPKELGWSEGVLAGASSLDACVAGKEPLVTRVDGAAPGHPEVLEGRELASALGTQLDSFAAWTPLRALAEHLADSPEPARAGDWAMILLRIRDTLDDHRDDPALCAELLHQFGPGGRAQGTGGRWSRRVLAKSFGTTEKRMRKREPAAVGLVRVIRDVS